MDRPHGPSRKLLLHRPRARTQHRDVLCFAHVTNQMARIEGDFEKGEEAGARDSLALIATVARGAGFGA